MAIKRAHLIRKMLDAVGQSSQIDTIDDRKRLQKVVYLLQAAGLDLGYRYGWYVKGPYSSELADDYYSFSSLEDAGPLVLSDGTSEPLRQVRGIISAEQRNATPLELPEWLELVASVVYLQRIKGLSEDDRMKKLRLEKPHLSEYVPQARAAITDAFGEGQARN